LSNSQSRRLQDALSVFVVRFMSRPSRRLTGWDFRGSIAKHSKNYPKWLNSDKSYHQLKINQK